MKYEIEVIAMLEVEAKNIAQARRIAKRLRILPTGVYGFSNDIGAWTSKLRTLTVKVMKKEDPK